MNAKPKDLNTDYNSIDVCKLICSYLVITIHCTPFLIFGEKVDLFLVSTVSRIAVPFFFACSGFLFFRNLDYYNDKIINCKSNRNKLCKYVGRIFLLYIVWSAIYLTIQIPEWYNSGWLSLKAFIDYFISVFRSSSYYHLWYLIDTVYATILIYFTMSFLKRKVVYVMAIVLYLLGVLVYSYYWLPIDSLDILKNIYLMFPAMWDSVTRAFPLLLLGLFSNRTNRVKNNNINLLFFIISLLLLCTEFYCINTLTENHKNFSYIIFTVPLGYFFFSWVMNLNINLNKNTSKIIRNMSTIIYCVHPLVLHFFKKFDSCDSIYIYLFVLFISTIVSYLIIKTSKIKLFSFFKYLF